VKDPLNYSLLHQVIPEANSCKYLGIILSSDLSWTDHVNYTAKIVRRQFFLQCVFLKMETVI
jgi:hypothetical protein